jgi:hypothetical protein
VYATTISLCFPYTSWHSLNLATAYKRIGNTEKKIPMAHKHNRRRSRPRSRHGKAAIGFDSLALTDCHSFNSSSPLSPASIPYSRTIKPPQPPLSNSISARHWQNRYTAWQNREAAQRREESRIEAEQLKIFGGEPGDDTGLCFKMMEAFEGMEWVDCME